jgi:hypothetical protein
MVDTSPETALVEPDEQYTVEAAAWLTGRSEAMVRRYIRQGVVDSVRDPSDGRRRLIPWDQLTKIVLQPKAGMRRRKVVFTMGDGSTITRVLAVSTRKEG